MNKINDLFLNAVFWTGVIITTVSIVTLLAIQLLRLSWKIDEWYYKNLVKRWQILLLSDVEKIKQHLPLSRRAKINLLSLWIYLHDALLGEIKENLNKAALLIGLDQTARQLIRSRQMFRRMLGIAACGQMKDESVWEQLVVYLNHHDITLSLVAARALVQINPPKGCALFLNTFPLRPDWPVAKVDSILNEADFEQVILPILSHAIFESNPNVATSLLRYIHFSNHISAIPLLRRLLEESTDPNIISSCLSALGQFRDRDSLENIRRYTHSPNWHVRLQAVSSLGKLGTEEDIGQILHLLRDPNWWVRYRAAQALGSLPALDLEQMKVLQASQTDLYARDILQHVIAEQEKK